MIILEYVQIGLALECLVATVSTCGMHLDPSVADLTDIPHTMTSSYIG